MYLTGGLTGCRSLCSYMCTRAQAQLFFWQRNELLRGYLSSWNTRI